MCVCVCVCVSLRFDQEPSPENRLYLDCFCVVARGIGVSHVYITMGTGSFDACPSWYIRQVYIDHKEGFIFGPWAILSCDLGTMFGLSKTVNQSVHCVVG